MVFNIISSLKTKIIKYITKLNNQPKCSYLCYCLINEQAIA